MANVRLPTAAPLPKEGEVPAQAPTSIAGLLSNAFSGPRYEPQPEAVEPAAAPAPAPKTQMAKAKPVSPAVFRTASTPSAPAKPEAKRQEKAVAEGEPQLRLSRQDKDKNDAPRQGESQMRTAFSAPPPASTNGTLSGAQPVVPAGSFDSRWSGFR
jgi:hypothetical protein